MDLKSCSDAGLACYVVGIPNPIDFATTDVAAITAYQESMASYAECWVDDGPYRRTASCVADVVFKSRKATIETAITSVQNQLVDATGAALTALQSTQSSLGEALTATQRSMDNIQPSPSPAEPADLDGATVGTIVVASLIGVALVGGAIAAHLEL